MCDHLGKPGGTRSDKFETAARAEGELARLEYLAAEGRIIRRPGIARSIALDQRQRRIQFCVHFIEIVKGQCLQCHRDFGASVL